MTNNTTAGVRKSQFNAVTTISGTATFDFVEGGVNKKITFDNLIPLLGATGTIVQVGDAAGTPVLDVQGTVNGIRNLVGGAGIKLDITAENSLEISTSYTFDETGEALVTDPSATNPDFKSLVAGADVTLTSDDDTITISLDPSAVKPANQVIVNTPIDFPEASGGVRTLAANTDYLVGDNVDMGTDRFVLSVGTNVRGLTSASSITSATTGALFTGDNVGFSSLQALTLSVPNGDIFDINDSTQGTSVIALIDTVITACDTLGAIGNVFSINFSNSAVLSMNDGLDVSAGQSNVISLRQVSFTTTNASCKFIDLGTSTSPTIEFRDLVFNGASGTIGISGVANNGNIVAGSIALVESCEFLGAITALENITVDDFRWQFVGNSGVSDTFPDALLFMTNNATATVISAVNTPTLVLGTWVVQDTSHFTGTAAGRATYNGERDLRSPIDVVATVEPVSGTNKDIVICVAVNGVVVAATCMVARVDSSNPVVIPTVWQHTFTENNYVEVFVENRTDAVNILVSDVVLRIR